MPRQARNQSLTDYYHVMIRGINREFVFKSDEQKEKFIDLMKLEEKECLIKIGPVFGERYKSENIENDAYMLQVIRYIHNNSIKANMVKYIENYPWSSYKCYIKESSVISKEEKDFILSFFNNIDKFIDYHKQIDNNEYLEIKEDREKYRLDR